MEKHTVSPQNAPKFLDWLSRRGGIAIWESVNLSNPGRSWSTPALTEDGKEYPKPTWEADSKPSRIITDASEIVVVQDKEVKRFHVAVRMGSEGFMVKCTDASTRRIRKAVEQAGKGAYYEFDYATQEAVIMAPDTVVALAEWGAR